MSAHAALSVSDLLGLRKTAARSGSALGLMSDLEKGLPLAALDRIAHAVAPEDSSFSYRLVPRATLARRRAQPAPRLTPEESARVARLASVWALATDVLGDEDGARRWLFHPHMMLEGRRPVDVVLASEFGRPLVEGILGGLKYGTAV
ncbi:MAG TPA: antitoxin Xre/MbcA/ParS toxin-binding domain-containing protein [Acetobacteraceae bacterium]|jgi:putative toxin-antitoxin system antitoxin component (TIGR02293 family)|nr:antitoxin Xre/MbcA/ParS toxin-binding domain-containing protein [Acetobacteraceae bacterium]